MPDEIVKLHRNYYAFMEQRHSEVDLAVVGAGPAGCAAALAARQRGARVLLIDLVPGPGGAPATMGLGGVHVATALAEAGIDCRYQTTLLGIGAGPTLRLLSPGGVERVPVAALLLATGGREQTRGNLALPGTRPAGVVTAGAALRLLFTSGRRPGRRAVVCGGGHWRDTVAAKLEAAGVEVQSVATTVTRIEGWPRLTTVVLEEGRRLECDLLVLATALRPWLPPALAPGAALPGVFVAGAAARGEIDASEAAAVGAEAGRRAVDCTVDKGEQEGYSPS
jgi:NADPH-dependent 2,4-dienoyl-CoA reductase/sulfur reductase-like enzyme